MVYDPQFTKCNAPSKMTKGLKFEQNNSQVNNTTVLNHVGERRCQFRTSEQADAIHYMKLMLVY